MTDEAYAQIQQQISEIVVRESMDTARRVAIMMSNHYNQVQPYYLINQQKPVSPELETKEKELIKKDKEIKELRKRLEGKARELHEKEIESTNYKKIINRHKCDNRKTFISDVKKDE